MPETIDDIFANVPEAIDFTKNLVKAAIFSNYSRRRLLAKSDLRKYLGKNISVASIEEDGLTYAYLHLQKNDEYIFVGKYHSSDPVFEEVPREKEIRLWRKM